MNCQAQVQNRSRPISGPFPVHSNLFYSVLYKFKRPGPGANTDPPTNKLFLGSQSLRTIILRLLTMSYGSWHSVLYVHCTLFVQILAKNMYIKIRSAGSRENNLSKLDSSGKVKALLTVDFFFLLNGASLPQQSGETIKKKLVFKHYI